MNDDWQRNIRLILTVVVFGFMTTSHSLAQQPATGQISGHVTDVASAAVGKANVFVRRNMPSENDVKLVTHTDSNGDFVLTLPEGGFDILITSPGFISRVETIPVFSGKKIKIQWKLKIVGCNFPGMICDSFETKKVH